MKNLVSIIVVLFSLASNAFATTQDKKEIIVTRKDLSNEKVEIVNNKYITTYDVSMTVEYSDGTKETISTTLKSEFEIPLEIPHKYESHYVAVFICDNGIAISSANRWEHYSYDELDRYLNKDTILKQGKEQKKEKKSPKESIRFTEAILPKEMKGLKKLYPTKRDRRYF